MQHRRRRALSKLLEAAVAWANAGFSVIPVGPNKKPRIQWRDCQTNPWTIEQVETWWRKNPNDNVAVIPASAGFGVIDGDIYKEGGSEDLGQIFYDHGLSKEGVPICETGSGGLHFWFRCPAETPSGPLTATVDIKSSGGYVVVPPSSNEAGPYQWLGDSPLDCPIAQSMPTSLLEAIRDRGPKPKPSVSNDNYPGPTLFRAIDGREKVMADAVWWAGHRVYEQRGSLNDTQLWKEIAWKRFESRAKGRNGRTLEQDHGWAELESKINTTRPRLAQALGSNGLAINYAQLPDGRSPRREFVIVPWDEDGVSGDDAFLVEGLLSPASLSVLYGPSNSGKTFQAMALAFAVGTGTPFYGMRTSQGRAVYLAAEGAANILKRREAIKKHFAEEIANLDEPPAVDLIGDNFDFASNLDDVEAVAWAIGEAKLIIVDTLAAVVGGGDENTAPTMLAIVNAANRLIKATGAHVMLVHHMGKNEEKGARGHSSLRAALDTEIECKMNSSAGIGRLRVTKQRDMEMGSPLGFKLVPVTIAETKTGEVTSCIVEQTNYQEDKVRKSPYSRSLEKIIYNTFNAAARVSPEPQQIEVDGTKIAVIDAVDVKPVRNAFYGLPENEDASQDTARRRYNRALKEVCGHGDLVFGSGKIGLLRTNNERQA